MVLNEFISTKGFSELPILLSDIRTKSESKKAINFKSFTLNDMNYTKSIN